MVTVTPPTPALSPAVAGSVGFLLHKAAQRCREGYEAGLAPLGLQARQAGLLLTLEAAGPLSQLALGGLHRIDRTTMVALVDDLEARGLVERTRDPADRRAYRLTVTRSGRTAARRAEAALAASEADTLARLTAAERVALVDTLRRITAP